MNPYEAAKKRLERGLRGNGVAPSSSPKKIFSRRMRDPLGLWPPGAPSVFESKIGEYKKIPEGIRKGMTRSDLATALRVNRVMIDEIRVGAGDKEILGTKTGDVLKKIVEGKFDEVLDRDRNTTLRVVKMLRNVGIATDRSINLDLVKKCVEKNRILQKGEW